MTLMRKSTYKDLKNFKSINISNIKNPEKEMSSKTFRQLIKNKESNKSNTKRSKQKTNKSKRDKETIKNTEKENNNIIIINKQKLQQYMINDKFEQSNEKDKITNNVDKNNPKKSHENMELIQINQSKNTKKLKKQFCCPFLLCLKMCNNEENENESFK